MHLVTQVSTCHRSNVCIFFGGISHLSKKKYEERKRESEKREYLDFIFEVVSYSLYKFIILARNNNSTLGCRTTLSATYRHTMSQTEREVGRERIWR
jgi:hypothetical protein